MTHTAILRRLLIALAALGLISGQPAFAPPTTMDSTGNVMAQASDLGMPCSQMSGMQGVDGMSKNKMPCNTMTPDCPKQMACAQKPALAERFAVSEAPLAFATVIYWASLPLRDGLTVEPDLSPPIAS
jgi:hypothetical protein